LRVPRNAGKRQGEFLREKPGDLQATVAKSREGTRSAAELKHERLVQKGVEAFPMLQECIEPPGRDVAKSRGQSMLEPGAGDEKRLAMCFG
jgi:hypothetical protein